MASAPPAPAGTRIAGTPGIGRGRKVIATQAFAPGALIATFKKPLLAIPDGDRMTAMCNWCMRRPAPPGLSPTDWTPMPSSSGAPATLRACSGCHEAVYCDATCHRAHWRAGHKQECEAFKRAHASTGDKVRLPTVVRAVLQVKSMMFSEGDVREGTPVARAFGAEGWLASNSSGFEKDKEVWADIELQTMAALAFGGLPTDHQQVFTMFSDILCKIKTNAFDRSDADIGVGGIFVDPSLAMVNHSCMPNAYVSFEKRVAYLRAETAIEKGDEIEISYIDNTKPKAARQNDLRAYHFTCVCPRCTNDWDVYQVCKTSSLLPMNTRSLATDLNKLRNPPLNADLYAKLAPSQIEKIFAEWNSITVKEAGGVHEKTKLRWKLCRPLVEAKAWALEPLPLTMLDLAAIYQTGPINYVNALSLACFLATECVPYRLVAPFNRWRIKGVLLIARLLAHTAETFAGGQPTKPLPQNCPKELVTVLSNCDQVSMCEAMLRLVMHYGPLASSEEWDTVHIAGEMLQDIEQLEGREKESNLLKAWIRDPDNVEAKSYFTSQILAPIQDAATFAIGIMDVELGDRQT